MAPGRVPEAESARLRRALAAAGVALFENAPRGRADPEDPPAADLLRELLRSGDPRLLAAVPCLLVASEEAAGAAPKAAEGLDPRDRARLGLLHRLGRALAVSRGPDLRRLLGRTPRLEPLAVEPADLPDPSEDFGEACLWRAAEREEEAGTPRISAGVVRTFDTWLGILAAEGTALEPA